MSSIVEHAIEEKNATEQKVVTAEYNGQAKIINADAERLRQEMLRVAETADLAIDRIVATRDLLIDQKVLEKSHENDGMRGG